MSTLRITVEVTGCKPEQAEELARSLARVIDFAAFPVRIVTGLDDGVPWEAEPTPEPTPEPVPPKATPPAEPGHGGYACWDCSSSFASSTGLAIHRGQKHRQAELPRLVMDQVELDLPHACGECPRRFASAHGLSVHVGREHKRAEPAEPPLQAPAAANVDTCRCGHGKRRHDDGVCMVCDECSAYKSAAA